MRKFRNAAIAGMTAVTLVAGLNSAAFAAPKDDSEQAAELNGSDNASNRPSHNPASDVPCKWDLDLSKVKTQDPNCMTNDITYDIKDFVKKPTNSSVWGKRYNGDEDVYGTDLLGVEKNFGATPIWAKIWYVATILGVIGTAIGIGWLPIMNQLKAQGMII